MALPPPAGPAAAVQSVARRKASRPGGRLCPGDLRWGPGGSMRDEEEHHALRTEDAMHRRRIHAHPPAVRWQPAGAGR